MVKLTQELVLRSPAFINPLNDRELDLRGNKIPAIENLGTTQDQYDTIDLSDNEITKLENFPVMKRLQCLFFNNNHISRIAPNLGEFLPKLETLILTNNRFHNLNELDTLESLAPTLKVLSLLDNPVTKKPNYRLYLIHLLPNLKVLDFRKIKQKERIESIRTFGEPKKPVKGRTPKTEQPKVFTPGENIIPAAEQHLALPTFRQAATHTPEQINMIRNAIAKAGSMEEVARLRASLQSGVLPETTQTHTKSNNNVVEEEDEMETDTGKQ